MSIAGRGGERIWGLMAVVAIGLGGANCGSSNNTTSGLGKGGGAGGGGGPAGADAGADPTDANHMPVGVSNPPLTTPAVALEGGAAMSAGGEAQPGGLAHLLSAGGITIGPDFQAPAMPASQSAPAGTSPLDPASLGADVNAPGSIAITGNVDSRGGDNVRSIVSGGDIFVDGTLRGADLGGARQGLSLKAAGTVYVSGDLDTSGAVGAGQAGGALTIIAHQLIVTGKVTSAGGSGVTGGAAGALTIDTTGGAYFGGTLDASGGDAYGAPTATAGRGGDLALQAGGDVLFAGSALFHGGAASTMGPNGVQGGNAGNITVDASGAVTFTGTFDDRGGLADGDTGSPSVVAGSSGALKVGESTRPTMIGMTVPLLLKGGDGQAVGGGGGTVQLEPHGGDLRVSGLVDASGGDSAMKPGVGGPIDGHPGPDVATASLDVSGQIVSNGGSITKGASGDGAMGGTIKLVLLSKDGNVTIEPTGQVQTDGGSSGGAGTAGGGGLMYTFTVDGNFSGHGKLLARGGTAPDSGGTGGEGGFIYVFTGDGHADRLSGQLIIESDGLIDASGGNGTIGGSARNNGKAGVALFPVVQTDEYAVEKIAVLINSDGIHGSDRGWIDNRGQILVRGGKTNGNGGDVAYHGRQQNGNETPLPGKIDQSGDGTGTTGNFAGE
jgi:hypothetical protein